MIRSLIACLILMGMSGTAASEGRFEGRLILEDVAADHVDAGPYDPGHTEFRLVEDYSYIAADGRKWTVPKGEVVNGASIPKAFWSAIGGPWSGEYRNATVLHDSMTFRRTETPDFTNRLFYEALRAGGVSVWLAKAMYYAVREAGPAWDVTTRQFQPKAEGEALTEAEARRIIEEVRRENPTLDEIDRKTF